MNYDVKGRKVGGKENCGKDGWKEGRDETVMDKGGGIRKTEGRKEAGKEDGNDKSTKLKLKNGKMCVFVCVYVCVNYKKGQLVQFKI